jgi:hypothetical protein
MFHHLPLLYVFYSSSNLDIRKYKLFVGDLKIEMANKVNDDDKKLVTKGIIETALKMMEA